MIYEHEEWLRAVHDMTELDRAVNEGEFRRSRGLCGDAEDARYEY